MKLYKLTNEKEQTRGETQWGPNVTHTASGTKGKDLCSDAWIHAYTHPALAILFNPIHANFSTPQLWEASGVVGKSDGLKVGCRSLTTIKKIKAPTISTKTRIAFAILCSLEFKQPKDYCLWAKKWLSGKDRTKEAERAAEAAEWAAEWAARAAERAAAERTTAEAARAAAGAAWAAAWAARAAEEAAEEAAAWAAEAEAAWAAEAAEAEAAEWAARAAAWAAWAAEATAEAAAWAARAAIEHQIDFVSIYERARRIK